MSATYATDARHIPYQLRVIPFVPSGIEIAIQIPAGERYLYGRTGVHVVTGMKLKEIKEVLNDCGDHYEKPECNGHNTSILPRYQVTSFNIPIELNGMPVFQYSQNREVLEEIVHKANR